MPSNVRPLLIVLAGPTAVGKTDLAIEIARHLHCPIISADSRQVYRGLTIGTAAPTSEQLAQAQHYMVACREPEDYYSAYEFETDVLQLLDTLFRTNDAVLMTGGSMMYIDVVCDGIDEIPTISDDIRQRVWHEYETHGAEHMQQRLKDLDPEYYEQVDLRNTKRVIHAIEICEMAGKPYSSLRTNTRKERPFDTLRIAVNRDRAELFRRIDLRVEQMIANGLVEEARALLPKRHLNSLNTVGYKEMFAYLDGTIDLDEAKRLIKRNTRRYAKKQLAWFRLRNECLWFDADDHQGVIECIENHLHSSPQKD